MGLLDTSNQIVNNSLDILDNMMNSPFNKFLNETPILVDYYNINDLHTTTDIGLGTIDEYKGKDSPIRFNKIEKFPVYGLKALMPDMSEIEGELMDLSIEGEVTVLPNTIRPTPGDYFTFKFLKRDITFQVNEFNITTIQSNSYYKLTISMKKMDDPDYSKELDKQVVETFKTDLKTVGTNAKCLIESTLYDKINNVTDKLDRLKELYIDTFYSERYNSIVLHDQMLCVSLYDQFLTNFIQENGILKDTRCEILINYDNKNNFRGRYGRTFFRNIETKDISKMSTLFYYPVAFPTVQNPFSYYGEEIFFCLDLYENECQVDNRNRYFDHSLQDKIISNEINHNTTLLDAMIVRYINGDILEVVTDDEMDNLDSLLVEYSRDHFYKVPIIIYIMMRYLSFLKQK